MSGDSAFVHNGCLEKEGNLKLSHDTIVDGYLHVEGNIVVDGDLTVNGYINCEGKLVVDGKLICQSFIESDSSVDVFGDMEVREYLTCGRTIHCRGSLKVEESIHAALSIMIGEYLDCGGRIFAGMVLSRTPFPGESLIDCKRLLNGEVMQGCLVERQFRA